MPLDRRQSQDQSDSGDRAKDGGKDGPKEGDHSTLHSSLGWLGVGLELAGTVAVLSLLGYGLGRWLDIEPWGTIGGAMLGIIGGLYNLIKQVIKANR